MAEITELKQLEQYVADVDEFFSTAPYKKGVQPPEALEFTAESLGELLYKDYEKQLKTSKAVLRPTVQAAKVGFALLKDQKDGPDYFNA